MQAPNISIPAALIGEPTRAAMLVRLCDGHARTAGELAQSMGVSPQSASNHLALLLEGGLLTAVQQGRHRYFRLASAAVAQSIESLAAIAPAAAHAPHHPRAPEDLRMARKCYSHLAGRLGVEVLHALVRRGHLAPAGTSAAGRTTYRLTPAGESWAREIGMTGPGDGVSCLDWTERREHLAGPLGSQLLRMLLERGYLRPGGSARSLEVTARGAHFLQTQLGIATPDPGAAAAA